MRGRLFNVKEHRIANRTLETGLGSEGEEWTRGNTFVHR